MSWLGPIFKFLFLFPLLWDVGHRGFCCGLCQRVFCLCFPLGVFIVSGLTFRSLIHFEFIFVYGVRKCRACSMAWHMRCFTVASVTHALEKLRVLLLTVFFYIGIFYSST